jgi:hypothetical protein
MFKYQIVFYSGGMQWPQEIEAKGFDEAIEKGKEIGAAIFRLEWIIKSISLIG